MKRPTVDELARNIKASTLNTGKAHTVPGNRDGALMLAREVCRYFVTRDWPATRASMVEYEATH